MKRLSIALAVFNEEKNLRRCLSSVSDIADEIIIVDGGSSDRTVDIAKEFGAKIISSNNPPIFHINKQKALDACTADWILQLDADEVVPDALKQEIQKVIKTTTHKGFFIPRKNYFWGRWMKKTGVYPDYVIRLIKRGKAHFPCKSVHEQIEVDGTVGYLKNPLEHYSYETIRDYLKKANAYTSLTADEFKNSHVSKRAFFKYFFIKPLTTFFSLFVKNKGFMDGIHGFLFSLFSSLHFPIAYWKYLHKK
ncbi:MAG: glycosyltransferase family 2 protein [Patescibacteria group bacterium]|nr:glycosyltransferase family 2 protein [Patescibacteria group bacterium]